MNLFEIQHKIFDFFLVNVPRSTGKFVLAAEKFAPQAKFITKLGLFRPKNMDKHYDLVLLMQKYFDYYPFLYKPPINIRVRKGRIHLTSVKRSLNAAQTMLPLLTLVGIVYACGRAITIVGRQSPMAWMDIRIWAWSFMS